MLTGCSPSPDAHHDAVIEKAQEWVEAINSEDSDALEGLLPDHLATTSNANALKVGLRPLEDVSFEITDLHGEDHKLVIVRGNAGGVAVEHELYIARDSDGIWAVIRRS